MNLKDGIHSPGPKLINSKGVDLQYPYLRIWTSLVLSFGAGRVSTGDIDWVVAVCMAFGLLIIVRLSTLK